MTSPRNMLMISHSATRNQAHGRAQLRKSRDSKFRISSRRKHPTQGHNHQSHHESSYQGFGLMTVLPPPAGL